MKFYFVEDKKIGYINYEEINNTYIIKEVYIDEAYRGQKKASILMKDFMLFSQNKEIISDCPYASNWLKNN